LNERLITALKCMFFVPIIILELVIHECGHALACIALNVPITKFEITLLTMSGVVYADFSASTPLYARAIIGFAGIAGALAIYPLLHFAYNRLTACSLFGILFAYSIGESVQSATNTSPLVSSSFFLVGIVLVFVADYKILKRKEQREKLR
jgi:hypothetical protein